MTKNTPFFPIVHVFCTPKRSMHVQCFLLKNNPNYVNFWTSLIPPLVFEWPPQDKNQVEKDYLQTKKRHFIALHWISSYVWNRLFIKSLFIKSFYCNLSLQPASTLILPTCRLGLWVGGLVGWMGGWVGSFCGLWVWGWWVCYMLELVF